MHFLINKIMPRMSFVFIFVLIHEISLGNQVQSAEWLSGSDTAFIPKEIEDPECLGINK